MSSYEESFLLSFFIHPQYPSYQKNQYQRLVMFFLVMCTLLLTVSPSTMSMEDDDDNEINVMYTSRLIRRSTQNDNPENEETFYKECLRNEDCPINYCCTVGEPISYLLV
jgi:hypothetical protein